MNKSQEIKPLESMKCVSRLACSATSSLLNDGGENTSRSFKLRPCKSSVTVRSNATWKFGCAPKEAKQVPLLGLSNTTQITGYFPPNEASKA